MTVRRYTVAARLIDGPETRTSSGRQGRRRYDRRMAEYQITYWRELPSLVVVRDGDDVTKSPLSPRFQEAIDEAAMRLGDVSSDAYLAGWVRGEWTPAEGSTAEVADEVVSGLEAEWAPERVTSFLDALQAAGSTSSSSQPAGPA
jgi:Virulence factor